MATTKKFHAEELDDIYYLKDRYEEIENNIIDQRRWATTHELIFKELETGNIYQCCYQTGNTEYQDVERWPDADEDDMVECTLMKPVEVTVTKYVVAE